MAFDGKPLFRWQGTPDDLNKAMKSFEEFASSTGFSPEHLARSTLKAIAEAGGRFLPNKERPQMHMWAVLYLFWSAPTVNPNFPGYFHDHLKYDFDINIRSGAEHAEFDIQPSWPAAGQA